MANLEMIAIVLGILLVVTRLPAIFWPREFFSYWRKKVSQESSAKMLGAIVFLIGIVFIYLIWNEISLLQLLVGGFSILMIVKGVMVLILPEFPTTILSSLEKKASVARIMAFVGLLIGILLIYLGWFSAI